MAHRVVLLLVALLSLCTPALVAPAQAEPRVALVIGNGQYGNGIGSLANPPNDARLIARALADAGFQVSTVLDADQKRMKRAIVDFGKALASAGPDAVGLFYYAGHGVQVDGKNYLIPAAAEIEAQSDVDIESVDADVVLQQMEFAGNRMNIVILDACRNNPLPSGSRGVDRGLARMDAPTGSFIAYSTAPGAAAADGTGKNSPYSTALADAIENQRVPLEQLFRDVRVNVMNATGKKQVPWDSSSLTGEFYFKAPDGAAPQTAPELASTKPPAPEGASEQTTTRAPAPESGTVFRDCPDCPELVKIPAGSFSMGAQPGDQADRPEEHPAHAVTIAKPYALMKTEVTRDQFAAFVTATDRDMSGGCYMADGGDGKWNDGGDYMQPGIAQAGDHPVVCVSDSDAADYADWLSAQTGKRYRLPTDAEWEYAARAGKKTSWPWGNNIGNTGCKYMNAMDASGHKGYPINQAMACNDTFATTAPVGSFPANGFGLHDMLGNVWEWVSDCWHDTYQGAPADASSWQDGNCSKRAMRGGAWLENPWDSRFSVRWPADVGSRETSIGFRLARDLD
jgi:formylglycine-generating enzyme required for sulfatase activity